MRDDPQIIEGEFRVIGDDVDYRDGWLREWSPPRWRPPLWVQWLAASGGCSAVLAFLFAPH